MKKNPFAKIKTIDLHAAGEPCRVVYEALKDLPGATMYERKEYLARHYDFVRSALMQEPRGHKDMFGAVFTDPISPDADAGVIYMNSDGFLDMCVHGTICAARAMIELKTSLKDPSKVVFDAVCGKITAHLDFDAEGKLEKITVQNVPSFVLTPEPLHISLNAHKHFDVYVVFAGNFFAVTEHRPDKKLQIHTHHGARLIDLGLRIRDATNAALKVRHPDYPEIPTKVALTVIYERQGTSPLHAKNTVIFADGQMDRSPCGSGTSALMTYFNFNDELPIGVPYISESIISSKFYGRLVEKTKVGPYSAVIPQVSGMSYVTSYNTFVLDEFDPYKDGFLLTHYSDKFERKKK